MNLIKKYPITFWVLIIFLVFFIVNKISKSFLDITNFEKRFRPNFVEKVYGEKNKEDYLKVLEEQTYPLKYAPFIEFREQPRLGKFVAVSEIGNRCNQNNLNKCLGPLGGTDEIWIFGGSTSFGYGVKNNETIAAYLEKFYLGKKNIINFGNGFFYSTQERIFFQNLLTYLDPPYAAIFIDGANDFGQYWNMNETVYSNAIRNSLEKKDKDKFGKKFTHWLRERITRLNIYRLIQQNFSNKNKKITKLVESAVSEEKVKQLIRRFKQNHKINVAVGSSYGIIVLTVLQPVPIYEYSYTLSKFPKGYINVNEKKSSNTMLAYKLLSDEENSIKKSKFFLDLKNFKINDAMYVDAIHYSPKFNNAIAREIFNFLKIY